MSHFHSKLLITITCLFSLVCCITAHASVAIAITTPVPDLREAVDPPEGYQGCYQVPAGFYNGVWADGYEMCQYPNSADEGMWVSPHWECDDYATGECQNWSWRPTYWDQDWDDEWNSNWLWVSPLWDWRWDPHFDRRWDRHWNGHWDHNWRGNWDPDWRGHRGRNWHGERDRHWNPRWDGRKEPHREMRLGGHGHEEGARLHEHGAFHPESHSIHPNNFRTLHIQQQTHFQGARGGNGGHGSERGGNGGERRGGNGGHEHDGHGR